MGFDLDQLIELNKDQVVGRIPTDKLLFRNPIHVELWRKKKSGRRKKVWEDDVFNGITNIGKDHILDIMFNSATQITSWFVGIIDNASFSVLAAADTMASHAGWIEFVTYSQSTRVSWGSGASSGQSVTNASPAVFDITGSATLNGIFLNSNSTKSGTTGTLWMTGSFSSTVPVTSGDQLKSTYTISA